MTEEQKEELCKIGEDEFQHLSESYYNLHEKYYKLQQKVNNIEEENKQLKDECYKKRNDNKSLRGTLKATLETSNNRHNEIKRLLEKIEKLELKHKQLKDLDKTQVAISKLLKEKEELQERIDNAIYFINEWIFVPCGAVKERQAMLEILKGSENND